ncbi:MULTISPECIES: zinc-dependent alcohol dehydrogenase family protein [Cupriavidus]|uniref:Zinc-containing alcohol dehydrogenase superfamily n=1 Tax=Cupriavidus pinatubonensis (strain JMP 134 / LMG 1197) TaxID=264198 RepID=Q46S04_CUPPJ|nr:MULTISPECIES: zinc-dependent alcohol dehydrogenase family protein [Cupriavidus]QYY28236.1 zinc-dependent alcohol dehydrogenase family protein [Cupriavidus pinatubonensis]TPQ28818.1 quinone oxidoreductase [Cupriavidus pinatubonensis]
MSMQALVLTRHNGPLELTTVPRPDAAPGQVLVRIAASGLNPLDTKIRAGAAAHARHPLPLVLGIDMAGTVEAVGAGVSAFKPGDEVYGMTGGVGGIQGSLAQYAAVDAALLAHKPANLSMREAAALPLAFITAYAGIVDRAHLQAGQTVLVQGGAGGVGHIAVQLARALGAEVFATASEANLDLVRQLGATPIDYRAQPVEAYVEAHTGGEGFDLVVDTVGGATLDTSFAAVKHFGHVVSALGWGTHALAPLSFREASYSGVFTLYPLLTGKHRAHHGEMLREATRLAEAGALKPVVDPRHFGLGTAEAGYEVVAAGTGRVKVVVDVR